MSSTWVKLMDCFHTGGEPVGQYWTWLYAGKLAGGSVSIHVSAQFSIPVISDVHMANAGAIKPGRPASSCPTWVTAAARFLISAVVSWVSSDAGGRVSSKCQAPRWTLTLKPAPTL